jgi:hypothetical protein
MAAAVFSTVIKETDCSFDLVQDLRFPQERLKMILLCDMMTCNVVEFYLRVRETNCLCRGGGVSNVLRTLVNL